MAAAPPGCFYVFSAFAFYFFRSPFIVFRPSAALFLAGAPKIGEKGRFFV
jgi:hypothetical protein